MTLRAYLYITLILMEGYDITSLFYTLIMLIQSIFAAAHKHQHQLKRCMG